MELLDAVGALALTLAGLATVVTIILETLHRVFGIRRRNLARIMNRLVAETIFTTYKDDTGAQKQGFRIGGTIVEAETIWNFVRTTINNPSVAVPAIPTGERVGSAGGDLPATRRDRFLLLIAKVMSWFKHERSLSLLRKRGDAAGVRKPVSNEDWLKRLAELETVNLKSGVYDKVSAEHVLRRLMEIDSIAEAARAAPVAIEQELNRLVRKFEEYSSAVSADFKRRSQTYSVVIGIVLAFVANVDGLRIFNTFVKNPQVAQSVLKLESELRTADINATAELKRIQDLHARTDEQIAKLRAKIPKGDLSEAGESEKRKIEAEIAEIEKARATEFDPKKITEAVNRANAQLASLSGIGVPVGSAYFPHCEFSVTDTPNDGTPCIRTAGEMGWTGYLRWIVSVLVTGMLIGLGAPFWFDVAKRVAEVRAMFGGKGSSEARLSGKDANADPDRRKDIVKSVMRDAGVHTPDETGAVG